MSIVNEFACAQGQHLPVLHCARTECSSAVCEWCGLMESEWAPPGPVGPQGEPPKMRWGDRSISCHPVADLTEECNDSEKLWWGVGLEVSK